MKKFHKVVIFTSSVMIVCGAMLWGIGGMLGGTPSFALGRQGIVTPNSSQAPSRFTLEKTRLDSFDGIDMIIGSADLSVLPADDYYLEYSITGYSGEPVYRIQDGVFTFREDIHEDNNPKSYFIGFNNLVTPDDVYLKLYIPEDQYWKMIKIKCNDGDLNWKTRAEAGEAEFRAAYGSVTVDLLTCNEAVIDSNDSAILLTDLSAENLDIKNAYGSLKLERITTENLKVVMSDGTIDLKDLSAGKADLVNQYGKTKGTGLSGGVWTLNQNDGAIVFENIDLKKLVIDNKYGSTNLDLVGEEVDYNFQVTNSYGSIRINGKDFKEKANIKNKADRDIIVNNSDGSVTIQN